MKQPYLYKTHGTCSQFIELTLNDDDTIADVKFMGGCHGNLQGISKLVKGMRATEAIEKLNGIRCGSKTTSCPDQLCRALEQALHATTATTDQQ